MTPSDFETVLLKALNDAGVNAERPDVLVAWEVFKRVSVVAVECARDYLFFQVGDSQPEKCSDGYFGFVREFEMRGASGDEPVWFEQVHVEFKVPHLLRLGVGTVVRFSTHFGDYDEFFAAVEQLPQFHAGSKFVGFVLSVCHIGV